MTNVELIYNPFSQSTRLYINDGAFDRSGSRIEKIILGKPMPQWLNAFTHGYLQWNGFLQELVDEINEIQFKLTFTGSCDDYTTFSEAIQRQKNELAGHSFGVIGIELVHQDRYSLDLLLKKTRELRKRWSVAIRTNQRLLLKRDRLDQRLQEDLNFEELAALIDDYIELINALRSEIDKEEKDALFEMRTAWKNLLYEER